MRHSAILILAALAGCGPISRRDPIHAEVTVDTTVTHQVITGWEATAQAGHTRPGYEAFRDTLMYAAVHELGITRIRLEVRAGAERGPTRPAAATDRCDRYVVGNDNDDPFDLDPAAFDFTELDQTIEQIVVPLRTELASRGEELIVNANYIAFLGQCPASTPYSHADPEEYAEFVLATFLHMQERWGFVPQLWEVILEPENTRGRWTGRRIGEAIVATARRLEAHGFEGTRFVAPSVTKAGNAPRFFDEMLTVPGAIDHVEELSYHRYRGVAPGDIAAIAARGRDHGIRTSMLEHIGSGHEALHEDLVTGLVSAWQQYTLAYPKSEDDGAQYYLIETGEPGPARIRMADRTRYLRHYFAFVRPGAVRLEAASSAPGLAPVAFRNRDGRTVVVIRASSAGTATIRGLPPGRYGQRYTTAGETDVAGPHSHLAKGGTLTAAIPAAGVVTIHQY